MSMKLTRLVVLFLIVASLTAEPLAIVQPDSVGLAADRLARITAEIERDVAEGRIAGASGLISRRGKVAYFEARGMANAEKKIPLQKDTIFRIYSMTKPIAGVALMMLHEEGKFFLTEPVSRYIPELKGQKVWVDGARAPGDPKAGRRIEAKREITIQDLMRHTAGFTYGAFGNTAIDKMYNETGVLSSNQTLADMITKLQALPLLYHPGEQFHYSVAVDVQGRLIEVLSGERFDKFLKQRIFDPLGMTDTDFWVPKDKVGRFAELYSPARAGNPIRPSNPRSSARYFVPGTFYSGGGGLVSTSQDYLKFCQMMLNGGTYDGKRLLSRKTVELMTTDHLGERGRTGVLPPGYGFGLDVAVHVDQAASGSAASVGEYNWLGVAGTRMWIDPVEEMIGIYMVQMRPAGGRFGARFKQLAYQTIAD